ncbi:UDP-3-O-(3-hydroxymyristoyl)glucosamine N-acyltransferase [Bacteroidales bacterium SW292]|uniref:UDP-3-O-(3-hydroxymyristoyl)glucosamine N-acyltransferase n=1 Tax=Mediterranea sp. An20 TaxID=1965586 RepID=UPI000B37E604|nr:UDP-3-O-(3-hydroxymyristoyl)glucosamine N-acyltransferase [Mediterranea sp. An20]MBW9202402.1 UDP-3-O-(3-hydroxymyristoyl)glucosamine N-acyltransferase [Bacteroidales bacterium SW292]OUP09655.1 UDP-3-O-(3-hydroxymyristoyl)glucosamine N-acyltransferase [Mediterranea sp. An20]
MEFSAKQIAEYIHGEIVGDEQAKVHTFAKIEEGVPGALTFLANPKYTPYIYDTQASIVLVNRDFVPEHEVKATLIRVDNAYDCLARLLTLYEQSKPKKTGIDRLAFIAPTAQVGKDVWIAPFAYVGENAVIGDRTVIHPHATIGDGAHVGNDCVLYAGATVYHDCRVGNRCILHAGSVVGADGFGFAPTPQGYEKIPQIGIAVLEDDVEIGANTCIDRATMGATIVHHGAKIDNLVQVAHNDEIGAHTVMAAQVGIAGSTKVGEWCMFGGQTGIAGHIHIGDRVVFGAQSGVPSSVKSDQRLIGTPPMEEKPYFKSQAIFRKLPDMYFELNALRKELNELKKQLNK